MQFKLFFKQSFRDFTSKIVLYLTFSLFLILVISVALGMMSFSYGFSNSFGETLGHHRVNASLKGDRFFPAWVADRGDTAPRNYYMQEEKDQNGQGYMYRFLENLLAQETTSQGEPLIEDSSEIERLLLGMAYNEGYAYNLTQKNLLEDEVLGKYFDETKMNEYNAKIGNVRQILNAKYQTINLVNGYILQTIKNNSNWTLGSIRKWPRIKMTAKPNQRAFWEYLRTDESMGIIDQDTPWTLKINETNTQKIWKQIDLKRPEYQEYVQEQRLVYVQPYFLKAFNHHLGDVMEVHFLNWDNDDSDKGTREVLIAGTMTYPDNISIGDGPTFSFSYGFIKKLFAENGESIANLPTVTYERSFFNVASANGNVAQGQKIASDFFNSLFSNLMYPGIALQTGTEWSTWHAAYTYEFTQMMFLIIAYILGFFTLGLLFVVFYFITKQIVVLQRRTLFFLKAMGVKNSGLSLLTTLVMIIPLFIGFAVGVFGALLMQQIMYAISFDNLAFYLSYFSFNYAYFITLFGIILVAFLVFYLINISLMNSKSLTLEGINSLKTNTRLFEKVKVKLYKTPAKLRIGLSFAFKNIYKNLISYLILSITFGIILFGVQFNKSLGVSSHAYEKWNLPYQSVNYASELKFFAPTTENDDPLEDQYIEEYEAIENLDQIPNKITKFDPKDTSSNDNLANVIREYAKKVKGDSSLFTNWKDYYLDREFVKETLDKIADNPDEYNKFIKELTEILEEFWNPVDKDAILNIINLIDQIINKYREIRQDYNYRDGFTILMGKIFLPENHRKILTLSSTYVEKELQVETLAFEQNDLDTKNYFNFSQTKDRDFVIDGTYQDRDPTTNEFATKEGKLLRVNISSYLQSWQNLHHGDVIELEVDGLKSANNPRGSFIHAYIDKVVKGDTIRPTIFTSQVGLIEYIVATLNERLDILPIEPYLITQNLISQKTVYENLLEQLKNSENPKTLSNTVFSFDSDGSVLPIGVRYLTMPIFHQTDKNEETGSRIEDFYDQDEFNNYLNNLGRGAMIFSEVTKRLLEKAAPFSDTLQKFVWILLAVAFVVSSILITLVLLENREVILLFKAMGYQKSEINWYLISGYFISAILAVITGVAIALGVLIGARAPIVEFLSTSVAFVWSWEFILLAFGLAAGFCALISISIVIYTNIQKPKNAFVTL